MPEVTNTVRAVLDSTDVERGARRMRDATSRATDSMSRSVSSTTSALGTFARAFAGAFSATAITSFATSAVRAYARQEQALRQVETRIRSTGGAAGFTADQMATMASALQTVTTFGDEAILEMQALLATFTKIRGSTFKQAQEAILDVAVALNTDLKSAALQVGKALNDPILGVTALTRSGIQFTDQQKEQIETLVESGKTVEAQAIILKELNTQMGGAARATAEGTGAIDQMQNSVGDAIEVFGGFITNARLTRIVINEIREAADVLASNTSITQWAMDASDATKLVVFAFKITAAAIEDFGNRLGATFAIISNIEDLPAFLKRKLTGEGEATSIDVIIDSFNEDRQRLDQEVQDFVGQLENVKDEIAKSVDDIIAGVEPTVGGPPRRVGGGAADNAAASAKKATSDIQNFVESLIRQRDALKLNEDELLRQETALAITASGTQSMRNRAVELTEEIIRLRQAEEDREAGLQRRNELQARAASLLRETITPMEELNQRIADSKELLDLAIITQEEYVRIVLESKDRYVEAMDDMRDQADESFRQVERTASRFSSNFTDNILSATRGAATSWTGMVESMLADIARLIIQTQLVDPLLSQVFGGAATTTRSNNSGGFGGFLSGIFGAVFRQSGGTVLSGRPYVVGERGAELFVPQSSGTVLPNAALAGGGQVVNVTNNFTVQGGGEISPRSQSQIAARVGQSIERSKSRVR